MDEANTTLGLEPCQILLEEPNQTNFGAFSSHARAKPTHVTVWSLFKMVEDSLLLIFEPYFFGWSLFKLILELFGGI